MREAAVAVARGVGAGRAAAVQAAMMIARGVAAPVPVRLAAKAVAMAAAKEVVAAVATVEPEAGPVLRAVALLVGWAVRWEGWTAAARGWVQLAGRPAVSRSPVLAGRRAPLVG